MEVTANGEKHTCLRAVKGADFIRLYDAAGNETIAFIGIRDFGGYSISGGEWGAPAPTVDARLAAIESVVKGTPSYGELLEAVNILLGE